MARFAAAQTSATGSTNTLADAVVAGTTFVDTVDADGGALGLTAAMVVNGIFRITGGSTSTFTFPSPASVVAAIPNCQVGSAFDFILWNGGSGTATATAGTGNTIVAVAGTASPTTLKTQMYKGIVTNATAGAETVSYYTLTGLV